MSEEPTVFRFVTLSEHEYVALLKALEIAVGVLDDPESTFGTRLSTRGVVQSQIKALRRKERGVGVMR